MAHRCSTVAHTALLMSALLLAWPGGAHGHDFTITDTVVLLKSRGTFQVDMTVDLDALLLGLAPGHPPEEVVARIEGLDAADLERRTERLARLFERRVRVRFDGEPVPFRVSFPDRVELGAEQSPPTVLGVTARLTGQIPDGAQGFSFFASRSFRAVKLVVFLQQTSRVEEQLLQVGEESRPFSLQGDAEGQPGGFGVFADYLQLGFTHIFPYGYDHVLFVLGLYLLAAGWRPLLWQVTAFTIAHSLTLGLSIFDVVSLPSSVVEPVIALSIAYVAVENLARTEVGSGRLLTVFVFGLLHGLGFAGVLTELGLPTGQRVVALAAFNVGVELGQISVLVLAFLALGWARQRSWYRMRVVVPLSVVLAVVGGALAVQRLL